MSSLSGKVALITGGSKGIGAAIAKNLTSRGCTVVVNFASNADVANKLLASLPSTTPASITIQADVGTTSACRKLVDETVSRLGRLDFLVLNAAWLPQASLSTTSEEVFDKAFALNVKAPFFMAQQAAPHMPKDGTGRIIFFSTSLTGAVAITPNYTLYLATKGAVEQMVRVLDRDLGKQGISVNCVSPGPTGTDMFYEGKPKALVDAIAKQSPRERLGEPEEIASVVGFLVGNESRWVGGQNIRVNGGFV